MCLKSSILWIFFAIHFLFLLLLFFLEGGIWFERFALCISWHFTTLSPENGSLPNSYSEKILGALSWRTMPLIGIKKRLVSAPKCFSVYVCTFLNFSAIFSFSSYNCISIRISVQVFVFLCMHVSVLLRSHNNILGGYSSISVAEALETSTQVPDCCVCKNLVYNIFTSIYINAKI